VQRFLAGSSLLAGVVVGGGGVPNPLSAALHETDIVSFWTRKLLLLIDAAGYSETSLQFYRPLWRSIFHDTAVVFCAPQLKPAPRSVWHMFGVQLLYTVIYLTLCGLRSRTSDCEPDYVIITSSNLIIIYNLPYPFFFCWSHQWIHIYLFLR
jgi:hypothetical protein